MMQPLLRVAFWGAAAFAVLMALLPLPPALPGTPSDKAQHILAFFVLSWLAVAAYPLVSLIRIGLGLCALGALIEIAQMIPGLNRYGELKDWLADALAVGTVLSAVFVYRMIYARVTFLNTRTVGERNI